MVKSSIVLLVSLSHFSFVWFQFLVLDNSGFLLRLVISLIFSSPSEISFSFLKFSVSLQSFLFCKEIRSLSVLSANFSLLVLHVYIYHDIGGFLRVLQTHQKELSTDTHFLKSSTLRCVDYRRTAFSFHSMF